MNDHHRADFDRMIRGMFLSEGRATCTQDHLDSYWACLSEFSLHDVREALRTFNPDTFPKARKIAATIRQRVQDNPEAFDSKETRAYHYVRPGDLACWRCRLRVVEIESMRVAGLEESCPPAGRRLRVVTPPADRDAARQFYRDRANVVRPGSAWDRWTYADARGEDPNGEYEFSG